MPCPTEASAPTLDAASPSGDGAVTSTVPTADITTCSGTPPWTSSGTPAVTLTVDAAQSVATWNRYYENGVASDHANTILSTAWGRNTQNAMKKAHAEAGFKYIRFHGILDSDIGVYTEVNGTPTYVWTRFDQVYDAIAAAGMRPVVEISFMPPPLASGTTPLQWYNGAPANITPPKDWTKWESFMAAIVTHLEQRYGVDEVRNNWHFEIWNESSWMYSLGEAGYPTLYANTVKGLLQGDAQIRVGGPAASAGSTPEQMNALVNNARTNNLKLDFMTYHVYATDNNGRDANANAMLAFHETVSNTVKQLKFTGPILNDEFAGTSSALVTRDTEIAASFVAKTIHLIGTDANYPPPAMYAYWAISDLYEEINTGNTLAYREGNFGLMLKGDPKIPVSFDVAKPVFNAFRLLHLLGDERLATTGGTTNDGVNAVATMTSDKSAVQILVYNHVNGGAADSSSSALVQLNVSNLPFAAGTPLKVRHYMVDKNHSNSHTTWVSMGKPGQPTEAQWTTLAQAANLCYYETTAMPSGNSWSVSYPQNTYGVSLIVLSP